MTLLKLVLFYLTFPLRLGTLTLLQVSETFRKTQKIFFDPLWYSSKLEKPIAPNTRGRYWDGNPDHCTSRTGEMVDVGLLPKEVLKDFLNHDGSIQRWPVGEHHEAPPVSGDMVCGWLLGYSSPWNESEKPVYLLKILADWMIQQKEGPTERMDCGFRRNPFLVGAQALLPLALYWTAWKETKKIKYLARYLMLFWIFGYGFLSLVPTAHMNLPWPSWTSRLRSVLAFHFGVSLPEEGRGFYNDANCMRCIAVLQRQTSGLHKLWFRLCGLVVWNASKDWCIPFMDLYGLGRVREQTKHYVASYLKAQDDGTQVLAVGPLMPPYFGETWDEPHRYYSTRHTNENDLGPYFEWFYAGRK